MLPLPRLWLWLDWSSRSGEPQRQLWLVSHILALATPASTQCRCQVIVTPCVRKCCAATQLHRPHWRSPPHTLRLCTQHSFLHPGTHVYHQFTVQCWYAVLYLKNNSLKLTYVNFTLQYIEILTTCIYSSNEFICFINMTGDSLYLSLGISWSNRQLSTYN